jgi:hypothetical protein
VTLHLNERILKLWKSTHPFGTKVDENNFFTASGDKWIREAVWSNMEKELMDFVFCHQA